MSELPIIHEAGPYPPITRREFLKTIVLASGFLLNYKRKQESPPPAEQKKETGIIQTGLKTLEIEGKKYEIKINPARFKEMVLYETPYLNPYGENLPDKVERWLSQNALEIQIFDGLTNPLMATQKGFFTPAELNFLSGRTVIGIHVGQIMELARIRTGNFNPFKSTGDPKQPFSVLAHETGHFLEYIRSPQRWLEIAQDLRTFLKDRIINITGSLFGLGLGLKFFRAQQKEPVRSVISGSLVLASIKTLLNNLSMLGEKIYIGATQGIEGDDIHGNYFKRVGLENFGRIDFGYQNLVYEAIEFNQLTDSTPRK